MKQHVTIEQLNELSQSAREKLRKYKLDSWAEPLHDARKTGPHAGKIYYAQIPTEEYLLSIGQMIEFLGEDWWFDLFDIPDTEGAVIKTYDGELCDALWETVKEVLELKQ